MGAADTLRRWLEIASLETPQYCCRDCGKPVREDGDCCPECGGDLAALDVTPEYGWEPMY